MTDDIVERLRKLVILDEVGSDNPLGREAADALERLRQAVDLRDVEIEARRKDLARAEAVITAIAAHADCKGRSVWGCMDLIRDTLSEYDHDERMYPGETCPICEALAALTDAEDG